MSKIKPRLFWILSDGAWHSVDEIVELSKDVVRPERAARAGASRSGKRPLEKTLAKGQRDVLIQAIVHMRTYGRLVETENVYSEDIGKERMSRVRLMPDAWERTLALNKYALGMLLAELRSLIEARRAQPVARVLPISNGPKAE